jgi:CRP/FNR family cyclic AMP-dependent transcriptional regulator
VGRGIRSLEKATTARPFDVRAFLASHGSDKDVSKYDRGETVFVQGDACDGVRYVESGGIKVSVRSKTAREAVVGILGPDEFFGEGCLTGTRLRTSCATAITPSVVRRVGKARMILFLHDRRAMSDQFIAHLLSRRIRIEQDLVDQLFNSTEKRVARTLLLLAGYGGERAPVRVLPNLLPATLAKTAGTTTARATVFLNKFKKLGFIEYSGTLPMKINPSLLSVVLHD